MSFIVFEGIDGSGKSTLQRAAVQELGGELKLPPLSLREPGSTTLGERVRATLLDPATGALAPWTEACLFTAARAELVCREIRPALSRGVPVFLDRYYYSTVAYQGYGSGLDPELLLRLNLEATGGLRPDLVILCDLKVSEAQSRRGESPDRMEAKGEAYFKRVRAGYQALAKAEPDRFRIIETRRSRDECARDVIHWCRIALGL